METSVLFQGRYASVDDPIAELVTERSAIDLIAARTDVSLHQVRQSRRPMHQSFSTHRHIEFVHGFAIMPN